MSFSQSRRNLLTGAAAGALASTAWGAGKTDSADVEPEVRYEYLHPREIEGAMKTCSSLFLPLGTLEWHGLHNVIGVDALKAHALCIKAAQKGGGLVAPPLYGGVGGLDESHTFVMDPENDVFSNHLRPWLERLCREAARNGFKAILILTGHYGAAQQIVVRETAVRMTRALGIPVLGTPEYFLALDEGYLGDHAAWGETSLMMHLYPDTVDLSRLEKPPYRGVFGRDPKESTEADGRRITETIVSRLATLAKAMPTWDEATIDRFNEAEAALVARQLTAPRGKQAIWVAWNNNGRAMRQYGAALVKEQFETILEAVKEL